MRNIFIIFHCTFIFLAVVLCANSYGQQNIIYTKRSSPKGIVRFSESSKLTGVSDTKYVDGYVGKVGNSKFVFPVGADHTYRPFAGEADAIIGAYFHENAATSSLPTGGPFSLASKDVTLTSVSFLEFWDIDGANATKLSLSWNAASDIKTLTSNSLASLTIAGWNPVKGRWEKIVSALDQVSLYGNSSTLLSGSISTVSSLIPDTYSVYTLASLVSAPLPVTLLSFDAIVDDLQNVQLSWTSSMESNSQQFDIEHSGNGKIWNWKETIQARGESVMQTNYSFLDQNPQNGENLYRIKMVDRDGSFTYTRVRSVNITDWVETTFYPNPVSDMLFMRVRDADAVKEVNLFDLSGRKVFTELSIPKSGIDIVGLPAGIYLANIVFFGGKTQSKKIIITH